jgi:pantothenate kinase
VQRIGWPDDGADVLAQRALRLLQAPGQARRILGLAGAPGSGKSTLAAELTRSLQVQAPGQVALLGMDAFHLAHRVLQRRGQTDIKGAPETFDAVGYLNTLARIKSTDETVYAPVFDRSIEDSIAHAVEIGPAVKLIITEGNYLLLDADPWRRIRPLLDEAWFVSLAEEVRQQRLLRRHRSFGRSDAEEHTFGSDQRNAELINTSVLEPDVWIDHLVAGAARAD